MGSLSSGKKHSQISAGSKWDLRKFFIDTITDGFMEVGLHDDLREFGILMPEEIEAYVAKNVFMRFFYTSELKHIVKQDNSLVPLEYIFEYVQHLTREDVFSSDKIAVSVQGANLSLFMAGLFPENLERRGLSAEMYTLFASSLFNAVAWYQKEVRGYYHKPFDVLSHNAAAVVEGIKIARDYMVLNNDPPIKKMYDDLDNLLQ